MYSGEAMLLKFRNYKILIASVFVFFGILSTTAQVTLNDFRQLYPKEKAIITENRASIKYVSQKGVPYIEYEVYREILLLGNDPNTATQDNIWIPDQGNLVYVDAYSISPQTRKPIKATFGNTVMDPGDGIFFDDNKYMVVNYPLIGAGAKNIIRYKIRYTAQDLGNRMVLSYRFPVHHTSVTLETPKNFDVDYLIYGAQKEYIAIKTISSSSKNTVQIVNRQPLKKVIVPDDDDYYYNVLQLITQMKSYSLKRETKRVIGDVNDLHKNLNKSITLSGQALTPTVAALADSLTIGLTSNNDIAKAIYQWITKYIKYVAWEDGENGLIPRPPEYTIKRRYGDCKDMAHLMVTMLNYKGVKAAHVWIGTRDIPYRMSDIVSHYLFNHMIVAFVNDFNQWQIADPTVRYIDWNIIPASLQTKEGLINISNDSCKVLTMPVISYLKNTKTDSMSISLMGDSVIVEGKNKLTGYCKQTFYYRIINQPIAKQQEQFKNYFLKGNNKFKIELFKYDNFDNPDETGIAYYKILIPDYVKTLKNSIIINMNIDKNYNYQSIDTSDFTPEYYSIYYQYTDNKIAYLEIPEGYSAPNSFPELNIDNALFTISGKYTLQNNGIHYSKTIIYKTLSIKRNDIPLFNQTLKALTDFENTSIELIKNP